MGAGVAFFIEIVVAPPTAGGRKGRSGEGFSGRARQQISLFWTHYPNIFTAFDGRVLSDCWQVNSHINLTLD